MSISRSLVTAIACLAAFGVTAAQAQISYIGKATIPGQSTDLSGLSGPLLSRTGTPAVDAAGNAVMNNRLGAFGSAISYAGFGNRYITSSDRGFGGGDFLFDDRYHAFDITVDPLAAPSERVRANLVDTKLLRNEQGVQLTGNAYNFTSAVHENNLRFDPEGIRVGRTGTLFMSDEYGPTVYEFNQQGQRLRALNVPQKYQVSTLDGNPTLELPPNNTMGRQTNRGMEGLAISPDGGTLFGLMQNPLIQDGALNNLNQRRGIYTRILKMDTATGATSEYIYTLDSGSLNGVNEILAINDHEFLVIERDSFSGNAAVTKKIFKIDISGATDVSGFGTTASNGLPQSGALPAGVVAATKELFLNVLDPAYGLAGTALPEKFEGLSWGPDLADGSRLLLVSSDNDMESNNSYFYAFGINRNDPRLAGFQAQTFVPEPGSIALFLGVFGSGVCIMRRRSVRKEYRR